MATTRTVMLAIMLTKSEQKVITSCARNKGLTKSSYARSLLLDQLASQGVFVYNPAPQLDENISAQAR